MVQLGVNIDHFATIRNVRHTTYPDIVKAALTSIKAGADIITVHLREDRRHIIDSDVYALKAALNYPQLNVEIAPTDEMASIINHVQPHSICIVPEKRNELTTEGGLDLVKMGTRVRDFIEKTKNSVTKITLFLDPDLNQINIAKQIGVTSIEIHTGKYANTLSKGDLDDLISIVGKITEYGAECNAGHGLTFETASIISKIDGISTLHIGHFIVAESLFIGVEKCIKKMIKEIRG